MTHYPSQSLAGRLAGALRRADLPEKGVAWDLLAPFDEFHVRGLPAARELARALAPGKDARVLDIGSGLGGPARLLAAEYGCRVTGIDITPAFVEAARFLSEVSGLAERTTFVEADALVLPFGDGRFEFAWSLHVAMNIADRPGLYREARRVLAPGGKLALYDVVRAAPGPLSFPLPWAREPSTSHLVTAAAMDELLRSGGFEVVSWQDTSSLALDWMGRQRTSRAGAGRAGLEVVMGADFPVMTANLETDLRAGRLGLIAAILRRT